MSNSNNSTPQFVIPVGSTANIVGNGYELSFNFQLQLL